MKRLSTKLLVFFMGVIFFSGNSYSGEENLEKFIQFRGDYSFNDFKDDLWGKGPFDFPESQSTKNNLLIVALGEYNTYPAGEKPIRIKKVIKELLSYGAVIDKKYVDVPVRRKFSDYNEFEYDVGSGLSALSIAIHIDSLFFARQIIRIAKKEGVKIWYLQPAAPFGGLIEDAMRMNRDTIAVELVKLGYGSPNSHMHIAIRKNKLDVVEAFLSGKYEISEDWQKEAEFYGRELIAKKLREHSQPK